jgi:RecB family exonuclease
LSPAAIARFRVCPKRFFFQDVERRPYREKASPVLAQANAVHQALERFFGLAGEHRTVEVLHRALRWSWQFHRKQAFASESEERAYGEAALSMLSRFAEAFDLGVVPLAREQWVSCRLEEAGVELFGKVDRVDASRVGDGIELVDYKTGSRVLAPEDLSDEPAAQVYVVAAEAEYERPVERVRFIYLPTAVEVTWTPERDDVGAVRATLEKVAGAIAAETEFAAFPGPHCRWCPYALVCPDRGRVELAQLQPAEVPF